MNIKLLTFFIILTSFCHNSYSEPIEPPPARDGRITVAPTLTTDPIQKIEIGKFKAKFEKTTLS
jgi:hypothetical protein